MYPVILCSTRLSWWTTYCTMPLMRLSIYCESLLIVAMSKRNQTGCRSRWKRVEEKTAARKATRMMEVAIARNRNTSRFMELPSQKQVYQCYREYYNATSNESLTMMVCAVCAREVNRKEDGVVKIKLTDLPNWDRLRPITPHVAHDLFDGLLLEPSGVACNVDGTTLVVSCNECR